MDLLNPSTIKSLLKDLGLYTKKHFGQNFLVNKNTLEKIVETADIKPSDSIIEIGPGLGTLTKELLEKTDDVTSIEIDEQLIPILKKEAPKAVIINQNALNYFPDKKDYKVVANIPYYITSPLLNHFLQAQNVPKTMTLLTQKEVAEKILKADKKMSVLALQVALFGKATIAGIVPKTHFFPEPKVDSAILHIDVSQNRDKEKALKILKVAKHAFLQGRKKLHNTLPEYKEKLTELGFQDLRPEHLSIQDWEKIVF